MTSEIENEDPIPTDEFQRLIERQALFQITNAFRQARAALLSKNLLGIVEAFEMRVENQSVAVVTTFTAKQPELKIQRLAFSAIYPDVHNLLLADKNLPPSTLPWPKYSKDPVTAVVLVSYNTHFDSSSSDILLGAQAIIQSIGRGVTVDEDQELVSGEKLLQVLNFAWQDTIPSPYIFLLTN